MSYVQAMLLMSWRVSSLYDSGKMEMSHAAMAKAWIGDRAREVARLGR